MPTNTEIPETQIQHRQPGSLANLAVDHDYNAFPNRVNAKWRKAISLSPLKKDICVRRSTNILQRVKLCPLRIVADSSLFPLIRSIREGTRPCPLYRKLKEETACFRLKVRKTNSLRQFG
jgi:hypothetical protein